MTRDERQTNNHVHVKVLARECPTASQQQWIISHSETNDPISHPPSDEFWVEQLQETNEELRLRNHDSHVEQVAWKPPIPSTATMHMHAVTITWHMRVDVCQVAHMYVQTSTL